MWSLVSGPDIIAEKLRALAYCVVLGQRAVDNIGLYKVI